VRLLLDCHLVFDFILIKFSMGSTIYTKNALAQDTRVFIGGKEVELREEVDKSDLPDHQQDTEPSIQVVQAENNPSTEDNQRKYIPPATFYAVQKKQAGPLYAFYFSAIKILLTFCRHDPDAEGAVVMKAPGSQHIARYNKK
jgi:DNA repair and recombination protein RAD54B